MEKYYVELYEKTKDNEFKMLAKKECESLALAREKLLEWVTAGYAEGSMVAYVVKDLKFNIVRSIQFEPEAPK